MKNISLTDKDLILLEQVIGTPLEAFGIEDLMKETKLSRKRIQELFQLIKQNHSTSRGNIFEISENDLIELVEVFRVSCDILDPIELPTITGYSWKESQDLLTKLRAWLP